MAANKKLIAGLIIMVFIIAIILNSARLNNVETNIKKNKAIAIGKVISSTSGYKGSHWLNYEVYINQKKYTSSTEVNFTNSSVDKLINKQFPVVYSTKNPENNRILVDQYDFKQFDIPFPDSLDWVTKLPTIH